MKRLRSVADRGVDGDGLPVLPARRGHFLLESGYHTDLWLTLDALFTEPAAISPLVHALATKLRAHAPTAVCGSLLGGAFLAQALAAAMGTRFYFSQPASTSRPGLFTAEYQIPSELARRIRGERVAVVDDVISAGSSARATVAAATRAGAHTVAIGALLTLGETGVAHFASKGIPLETLECRPFNVWRPDECPLCREARPLEDPVQEAGKLAG
jgi:orotate phosphoribosyltransferase